MVAFSAADLPASINSVEKLSVWATTVLNNLHFQQTIQEAPGVIERVAVSQPFPITSTEPYKWRYVGRVSVELSSNWQGNGKVWEHAQPLSASTIPLDFKS